MNRDRASNTILYALLVALPLMLGCYVNTNTGGCSPGRLRGQAERSVELTAPLSEITSLHVATDVGAIRIEAAEVDEIQITARITVRAKTQEEASDYIERVHVRTNETAGKLIIETVKPVDFGRNELALDLTIAAPSHLAVTSRTKVGDIHLSGFDEHIAASTDVGKVVCEGLRSEAEFHANVGDIHLTYATDARPDVELVATSNVGNIEFVGPPEVSARLSAATNVGSINTDRPLTVSGPMKSSITATLGQAEGDIVLTTNVGSINIR